MSDGIDTTTTTASPGTPYVESPVITTAARTVATFVLVYGMYITLQGTALPGGGFQGGVMLATSVVLLTLAFGLVPTASWIGNWWLVGLFFLGLGLFGLIAMLSVVFSGAVLEVAAIPGPVLWTVKVIEIAIAVLVSGVIVALVIWIGPGMAETDGGENHD